MRAAGLGPLLAGLHLAEGLLSAALWGVGLALGGGPWALFRGAAWAPVGAAVVWALWAFGLARLAARRRRRAARVLEAVDGHRRWPTVWHPLRVPSTERVVDGVPEVWRVHAVVRPDGALITAEVGVAAPMGPVFVAWPARRDAPAAARGLRPVMPPPVGGLLLAARDPDAVGAWLRGREAALRAAVPEDGSLAVYPWGLWWRSTATPSAERLSLAARALRSLGTAPGSPGRS